jgi:hypothetical protein
MTLLNSTLLIYFLIGGAVSVAVYLSDMAHTPAQRLFLTASSLIFWPLCLPLLLQRISARHATSEELPPPGDEIGRAIRQVESELNAALRAANVPDDHNARLNSLHERWSAQAAQIREIDRLLASPQYSVPNDAIQAERPIIRDGTPNANGLGGTNAMCAIVERLRQVRELTNDELTESLAKVRQLAALLYLARFTRGEAGRISEILAELDLIGQRIAPATDFDWPIPSGADGNEGRAKKSCPT